MTNEELAERIYAGDTGLYSVLWDNLKRYIYRLCNAYYNRRRERLTACDVTREDLEQEAYFTLYDAVEAYHTTDKRYKVITCLKYPLLNCFNGLAGYRVHRACKEPLNGYRSLYEPIDGEDGALLVEMIPDEAASFEDDAIAMLTAPLYMRIWRGFCRAGRSLSSLCSSGLYKASKCAILPHSEGQHRRPCVRNSIKHLECCAIRLTGYGKSTGTISPMLPCVTQACKPSVIRRQARWSGRQSC